MGQSCPLQSHAFDLTFDYRFQERPSYLPSKRFRTFSSFFFFLNPHSLNVLCSPHHFLPPCGDNFQLRASARNSHIYPPPPSALWQKLIKKETYFSRHPPQVAHVLKNRAPRLPPPPPKKHVSGLPPPYKGGKHSSMFYTVAFPFSLPPPQPFEYPFSSSAKSIRLSHPLPPFFLLLSQFLAL